MSTLLQESASVLLGPSGTRSDPRSEAEPGALLARDEVSTFPALTWLTVGLGMLVTGLAVALTVLAIVQ